jgi:hypothetical protein
VAFGPRALGRVGRPDVHLCISDEHLNDFW